MGEKRSLVWAWNSTYQLLRSARYAGSLSDITSPARCVSPRASLPRRYGSARWTGFVERCLGTCASYARTIELPAATLVFLLRMLYSTTYKSGCKGQNQRIRD